jgi:archaellum biogenesis protein FlaJ (TadC family)
LANAEAQSIEGYDRAGEVYKLMIALAWLICFMGLIALFTGVGFKEVITIYLVAVAFFLGYASARDDNDPQ